MKRLGILILAILFSAASAAQAAEVKNVSSKQVGNRVQVTYDLTGDESEADVSVTITLGGKEFKPEELHLEGDLGKVRPGRGKTLWWNVLQDFPRGLDGDIVCEISAGGGKIFVSPTLGAKFVLIPAGTFTMGSPSNEPGRDNDETQHRVTLSKPFYMQTTEVTQGQWKAVMGNNPSYFKNYGDDCPVEQVSWNDVHEFIRILNQREGTDKYRLPTEAEWEYVARAGTTTPFHTGNCLSTDLANSQGFLPLSGCPRGRDRERTIRVGSFPPNDWGLYDMHGNVREWVQDWTGNYPNAHVTDPTGPSGGIFRVIRGGGWFYDARRCRSAIRDFNAPDYRDDSLGFRLARTH